MMAAMFKRVATSALTYSSGARPGRAFLIATLACICLPLGCSAKRPHLRPAPQECLRRVQEALDAFCESRRRPGATLGFVLADGRGCDDIAKGE